MAAAQLKGVKQNMKIFILSILACFSLCGCAAKYDERLLGSWKSDRERAVAEYCKRNPSKCENDSEKIEKLSKILFGHMVQTYTKTEIIVGHETDAFAVKYRIAEKAKNFVIVEVDEDEWAAKYKLTFDNDYKSFRVDNSLISEYFSKIQ